jgi:hypothetical protein
LLRFWVNANLRCRLQLQWNDLKDVENSSEDQLASSSSSSSSSSPSSSSSSDQHGSDKPIKVRNRLLFIRDFNVTEDYWYPIELELNVQTDQRELCFTLQTYEKSVGFLALDDVSLHRDQSIEPSCSFDDECAWFNYLGASFEYTIPNSAPEGQLNEVRKVTSLAPWIPKFAAEIPDIFLDNSRRTRDGAVLLHSESSTTSGVWQSTRYTLPVGESFFCLRFFFLIPRFTSNENQPDAKLHLVVKSQSTADQSMFVQQINLNRATDNWHKVQVNLRFDRSLEENDKQQFVIHLLLQKASKQQSIALDDLQLLDHQCPDPFPQSTSVTFECNVAGQSESLSIDKRCNFVNDCDDGSDEIDCGACEFDENFCGYEPLPVTAWSIKSHTTSNSLLTFLHQSLDRRSFAYTQSKTTANLIEKHSLTSQNYLKNAHSQCVVCFEYAGHSSQNFGLYLKERDTDLISLWQSRSDQIDTFDRVCLRIGHFEDDFQVRFAVVGDMDKEAEVALSYVHFNQCELPPVPLLNQACPPNHHLCSNRRFVSNDRLCDFENDCGDMSDEIDCKPEGVRCSFEQDTCAWSLLNLALLTIDRLEQKNQNVYQLLYLNRGYSDLRSGPGRDHSTNRASGSYVMLRSSLEQADIALDGALVLIESHCQLRLFVSCHRCRIAVELRKTHQSLNSLPSATIQSDELFSEWNWTRVDLDLTNRDQIAGLYQLRVKALVDPLYETWAAVDDLSLSQTCKYPSWGQVDCAFDPNETGSTWCEWMNITSSPQATIKMIHSQGEDSNGPSSLPILSRTQIEDASNFEPYLLMQKVLDMSAHQSTDILQGDHVITLISPLHRLVDSQTYGYFQLDYHMLGGNVGHLKVSDVTGRRSVLWQRQHTSGPNWRTLCLPIELQGRMSLQLKIEAKLNSYEETIAIKNSRFTYAPCLPESICSFDDDQYCRHLIEDDHAIQGDGWSNRKKMPNKMLKEMADHSLRTGYGGLLYALSDKDRKIEFNLNPNVESSCVHFWYKSHRKNRASATETRDRSHMEVIVVDESDQTRFSLWELDGKQLGDGWRKVEVQLPNMKNRQAFLIARKTEAQQLFAYAIDNLHIDSTVCPSIGWNSDNTTDCVWTEPRVQSDRDWMQVNHNVLQSFAGQPIASSIDLIDTTNLMLTYFTESKQIAKLESPFIHVGAIDHCLLVSYLLPNELEVELNVLSGNGNSEFIVTNRMLRTQVDGRRQTLAFNVSQTNNDPQFVSLDFKANVLTASALSHDNWLAINQLLIVPNACDSTDDGLTEDDAQVNSSRPLNRSEQPTSENEPRKPQPQLFPKPELPLISFIDRLKTPMGKEINYNCNKCNFL